MVHISHIIIQYYYPPHPSPEIRRGSTASNFSLGEMVLECHLLLKQFRKSIK